MRKVSPEEAFVRGYLKCALWSTCVKTPDDPEESPLDDWACIDDIDAESLATMKAEAMTFYQYHKDVIPEHLARAAGIMFWLTRNHHGSGFLDSSEIWGDATDQLNDAAHAVGERDLYVGDDWRIYQTHG